MNGIILTLLLVAGRTSYGGVSDTVKKFEMRLTTFNHAEWLSKGKTTYVLTDSSITITNTAFGEKKEKVVFSRAFRAVGPMPGDIVQNYGLDTLKDFYFNRCIMITSGNEYFLDVVGDRMEKHISLHHYYLKKLDEVIQLINSYLPQRLQCRYLSEKTEQDCQMH